MSTTSNLNQPPRQPLNQNILQPTKFTVVFRRIPNVVYFCNSVNLPGITLGKLLRPTPFVDQPVPGDKIEYDDLKLQFVVDEGLHNWMEIHDWLRGLGTPKEFQEYKNLVRTKANFGGQYSDGTVTILNNLNIEVLRFTFVGAFPTSISEIQFDSKQNANEIMYATAVFSYSYYDVKRFQD